MISSATSERRPLQSSSKNRLTSCSSSADILRPPFVCCRTIVTNVRAALSRTASRVGLRRTPSPTREVQRHVALDLQQVSDVSTEPGELPKTMAAWVIREERQGEPKDAFQVEEIEVPEPGAFEVIVRVMAAGVNYNNVWAALGKPVSVMALRRPPRVRPPHRRLGRVGRRVEGRRGRHALEARRRGRRALQPGLLRGPRGARPRPDGGALAEDLGL